MYFDSIGAAVAMGGHGAYVWSAYAITLLVLGVVFLRPRMARRRLLRDLRNEQRRATAARPSPASLEVS